MSSSIMYDQMREDGIKQLGLLQAVIKDLASDFYENTCFIKMNTLPTF